MDGFWIVLIIGLFALGRARVGAIVASLGQGITQAGTSLEESVYGGGAGVIPGSNGTAPPDSGPQIQYLGGRGGTSGVYAQPRSRRSSREQQ